MEMLGTYRDGGYTVTHGRYECPACGFGQSEGQSYSTAYGWEANKRMWNRLVDACEEVKKALEDAVEALAAALKEITATYMEIVEMAVLAQEVAETRKEERERWGHPPKKLIVAYRQPVKKIRPCARSFGRRL